MGSVKGAIDDATKSASPGSLKVANAAHQHEARHAIGVVDGESLRDAGPHRVPHNCGRTQSHRIQEREQIRRHVGEAIA